MTEPPENGVRIVVFLTEVDFSLKAHQELTPNMLKLCNLSEITDKSGSDVKNNKTENPIRRDSKSKRATRKFWTITINIRVIGSSQKFSLNMKN